MKYVAAIMAGGRSSRFGADKVMVEIAGKPMIAHVDISRPRPFPIRQTLYPAR
ncbi:MAG: molybdenum cofactor guanylyltransferase [Alphaproteobacteria bacterium]